MAVVDISDPANLYVLSRYPDVAVPWGIAVDGNQVLVGDHSGDGRLVVLQQAGGGLSFGGDFRTRNHVAQIAVAGDLIYLALLDGVQVLRRTPAGGFEEWAWYAAGGGPTDLVLAGDTVYVMESWNGTAALNIPRPTAPPGGSPTPGVPGPRFLIHLPHVAGP